MKKLYSIIILQILKNANENRLKITLDQKLYIDDFELIKKQDIKSYK